MALLSTVSSSNILIGIWKCWFLWREENRSTRRKNNNKRNPHMTPRPGIEPGPHWWEASALTTAPSLLPKKTNRFQNRCTLVSQAIFGISTHIAIKIYKRFYRTTIRLLQCCQLRWLVSLDSCARLYEWDSYNRGQKSTSHLTEETQAPFSPLVPLINFAPGEMV